LVTSFIKSSSAQLSKLSTAFIINKLAALYLSPDNYGFAGQFQSFAQLFITLSLLGTPPMLTKLISNAPSRDVQTLIFTQTLLSSLIISCVVSICSCFFYGNIFGAKWQFLKTSSYQLCILLVLIIITGVFTQLYASLYAGLHKPGLVTKATLFASAITTICCYPLIKYQNLIGVLSLLVITNLVNIFIYLRYKIIHLNIREIGSGVFQYSSYLKNLYSGGLYLMLSSVFAILFQIFLRNYIADHLNTFDVGLWQATTKVSELIFSLYSSYIGLYLLPQITKSTNRLIIDRISVRALIYLFCIHSIFLCIFFVSPNFFISAVFSSEYITISYVLGRQFLFDFARLLMMVYSITLLARGDFKLFLLVELVPMLIQIVIIKTSYLDSWETLISINGIVIVTASFLLIARKSINFYCSRK
jgi:O-antigen/teichoic acid export membrane protein